MSFQGMNAEIEAMMAEQAAAEDPAMDKDVSDAEMTSRLTQNIAKKFGTKRDSGGKPAISK